MPSARSAAFSRVGRQQVRILAVEREGGANLRRLLQFVEAMRLHVLARRIGDEHARHRHPRRDKERAGGGNPTRRLHRVFPIIAADVRRWATVLASVASHVVSWAVGIAPASAGP
jgi:hypothetical protein